MCLITSCKTPLIADNDIICYKVVEKKFYTNGNTTYVTPFQQNTIKLDTILSEPEMLNDFDEFYYDIDESFMAYIGKGFFHSCADLKSSIDLINAFMSFEKNYSEYLAYSPRYTILSSVIPKNTKYYPGITEVNCGRFTYKIQSYASKSIIYQQEILND